MVEDRHLAVIQADRQVLHRHLKVTRHTLDIQEGQAVAVIHRVDIPPLAVQAAIHRRAMVAIRAILPVEATTGHLEHRWADQEAILATPIRQAAMVLRLAQAVAADHLGLVDHLAAPLEARLRHHKLAT